MNGPSNEEIDAYRPLRLLFADIFFTMLFCGIVKKNPSVQDLRFAFGEVSSSKKADWVGSVSGKERNE